MLTSLTTGPEHGFEILRLGRFPDIRYGSKLIYLLDACIADTAATTGVRYRGSTGHGNAFTSRHSIKHGTRVGSVDRAH